MSQMGRFEPRVESGLVDAGWSSGRDISESLTSWHAELGSAWALFPAARAALAEFGGIVRRVSRADSDAGMEELDLTPTLALGEEERFKHFEAILGIALYPLGEFAGGRAFLAIGADGRVFALSESVDLVGGSIDEALGNLLIGRWGEHFGQEGQGDDESHGASPGNSSRSA